MTNGIWRARVSGWVTGAVALGIAVWVAAAIDPNEKYNLMRQVTTQQSKANLLIVLDISGSMRKDINGVTVGVDSTGTAPVGEWTRTSEDCLCTSTGTGLRGNYFNWDVNGVTRDNFTSTAPVVSTVQTVGFNWGTASPAAGINADRFAVEWEGSFVPPTTGPYQLRFTGDDGFRVFVIIPPATTYQEVTSGFWRDQGATTWTSEVWDLDGCVEYAIKIQYYENTGGAVARLEWVLPSGTTEVIPAEWLYPAPAPTLATPTPTPTVTATMTLAPTRTATRTTTRTPTLAATLTATRTPTRAATATTTITPTPAATLTATRTSTRTATAASTATRTRTSTPGPTLSPTRTMTPAPTLSPTRTMTPGPTLSPTRTATLRATRTSTRTPTGAPTLAPTNTPVSTATAPPTLSPTRTRTLAATSTATRTPTQAATATTTRTPTLAATATSTRTATRTSTPTPTNTPRAGYGMSSASVLLAQATPSSNCLVWRYTLTVRQNLPSRMATVKNALGSAVSIYTPWVPPDTWPALSAPWLAAANVEVQDAVVSVEERGYDDYAGDPSAVPPVPGIETGIRHEIVYTTVWSKTWVATFATHTPDPGRPFEVLDANGMPTVGTGGVEESPRLVIEGSAKKVNWGMMVYSVDIDQAGDQYQIIQVSDTSDSEDVTAILAALRLRKNGGVDAYWETPTRGGLAFANNVMKVVAEGGSLSDDVAYSNSIGPDPKLKCDRLYGNILVTDGTSNTGNPGGLCKPDGANWADPCLACADPAVCAGVNGGPGCPDGGPTSGGKTICPDNYQSFAAGRAQEGWNLLVKDEDNEDYNLRLRTFVVGLSSNVSPCELNVTAYRGRSDASAVAGDIGQDVDADIYLPDPDLPDDDASQRVFDNPNDPANPYCNRSVAPCDSREPCHGHYAFFANNATVLADAIKKIVGSAGIGDYSTSGPTISNVGMTSGGVGIITSAQFPRWLGHVYAYDVGHPIRCGGSEPPCPAPALCVPEDPANPSGLSYCGPPYTFPELWDAGQILSSSDNNGFARRIYTWDPRSAAPPTYTDPIPVTTATLATLNTLCNGCGITAEVVDFIEGNDGAGTPRPWKLGAIMNSTPAIVADPDKWSKALNHDSFEGVFSERRSLIWLGSSDGMLHAFDALDGTEIIALIPPDLLAMQVKRYESYRANPVDNPTGQFLDSDKFVYGVANSPRFADIWDPSMDATSTGDGFRTVMYVGLGPGGTSLHAIDVTHPSPARDMNGDGDTDDIEDLDPDPCYGSFDAPTSSNPCPTTPPANPQPVKILWSRTGTAVPLGQTQIVPLLSTLGQTWNIPAVGLADDGTKAFELVGGNGYVPYNPAAASGAGSPTQDGFFYRMDPLTGALRENGAGALAPYTLTHITTPAPLVRNQGFAPSTIWQTSSASWQPDNTVTEALQPDLHGQLWLFKRQSSGTWAASRLADPGGQLINQPLYYNTPVAGYPTTTPTHNLMTMISGSFYEESTYVTGNQVGAAPYFQPKIFLVSRELSTGAVTMYSSPIAGMNVTDDDDNVIRQLGRYTQATAYPMIFTPTVAVGAEALAVFLVYDPTLLAGECVGHAYIIYVKFNPTTLSMPSVEVADAGMGAASGLAVGAGGPLAAHSFAGAGGKAHFVRTKVKMDLSNARNAQVNWWRELT